MKRNTPTCVGKTKSGRILLKWLQKHPHVRGEDRYNCYCSQIPVETPPRAWGRRGVHHPARRCSGNTPTCVGKTQSAQRWHPATRKHPHVRGEDSPRTTKNSSPLETPPRAWGRPFIAILIGRSTRNTPTCVGKTGFIFFRRRANQKHPHVRGEDYLSVKAGDFLVETPPRAWGRPFLLARRRAISEKHPHVRGEDAIYEGLAANQMETPPRAWGRPFSSIGANQTAGNTPTCVGKTYFRSSMYSKSEKHPHVRGEDVILRSQRGFVLETPPRAWGRLLS